MSKNKFPAAGDILYRAEFPSGQEILLYTVQFPMHFVMFISLVRNIRKFKFSLSVKKGKSEVKLWILCAAYEVQ